MSKELVNAWNSLGYNLPDKYYWGVFDISTVDAFQPGEPETMTVDYDEHGNPFWHWGEYDLTVDGIRSYLEEPVSGRGTVTSNYLCEIKYDYYDCDKETPGECGCYFGLSAETYTPCDYCWMDRGMAIDPERCGGHPKPWEPRTYDD